MTFQALLFCPDEKTTRVTTQVLNELEFSVETCTEPFAAVKKLMGQHFDAIVVDCDNEQNASLLFKSARNSSANQGSLAVAVVEGQAGVANAFRVGANLVLTKPINVEQAKSTLRVARGLLRKGSEAVKAVAPPPATSAPTPGLASPPSPKSESVRPVAAVAPPKPKPPVSQKPVPQPAVAVAKATTVAASLSPDHSAATQTSVEGLLFEKAEATPAPARTAVADASWQLATKPSLGSAKEVAADLFERPAPTTAPSGAASAPAPAREPAKKASVARTPGVAAAPSQPPMHQEPPSFGMKSTPAPSFASLDGQAKDEESTGGGSRIGLMVVLVLALLAAAYFGYTKFFASKHTSQPPVQPPPMTSAPPQPSVPTQSQAADSTATTIAQTPAQSQPDPEPATSRPTRPDVSIASSDAPEVVIERQPVSPKLVVKSDLGSSRPARTPAPASAETVDAPEIGNLANSDASAISTMMKSAAPVSTPVGPKEVIRVSQGVTQGLLLKRVQPVYPQAAMQMRVQGAVQLQAVIGKTGSVSNIKLLSGDPVLGKAAIQAVSQWKYKPYYLDGEPVDIQTQVTVNFKLP